MGNARDRNIKTKMRHPIDRQLQARDAKIIEYYVNNPDLPLIFIGNRFGMSEVNTSRIIDQWFPHIFGETIVFNSSIDSERAIIEADKLNLIEIIHNSAA